MRRSEFGLTPEAVRALGIGAKLELIDPIKLDDTAAIQLHAPRFMKGERLLVAGLGERYTCETSAAIPSQWQRFLRHLGHIPGQIGNAAYGVRCNDDDAGNFDYISGVAARNFAGISATWTCLRIPEQHYAVFRHSDHVSTIRSAWNVIWNSWLPDSEYEAVDAPSFERYDEEFNSTTGQGGFELSVAVQAKARGVKS